MQWQSLTQPINFFNTAVNTITAAISAKKPILKILPLFAAASAGIASRIRNGRHTINKVILFNMNSRLSSKQ